MVLIVKDHIIEYGIPFGSVLAITISYVHNQSILWAIIHPDFDGNWSLQVRVS
jgi:hypothetical protein